MIATLKKARDVVMRNNIDKKLADAVAEVRRLDQRYKAIQAELTRRCDWSYFESRQKGAAAEYAKDATSENLEKLILAEFLLERAQEKLAHQRRSVAYGDAIAHQFAAECPDWRTKLSTAASLHIQKAKANLESVTAAERERLGDEYDAEDVQTSPVVRRAAIAVKQWERMAAGIANSTVESSWRTNAAAVLNE